MQVVPIEALYKQALEHLKDEGFVFADDEFLLDQHIKRIEGIFATLAEMDQGEEDEGSALSYFDLAEYIKYSVRLRRELNTSNDYDADRVHRTFEEPFALVVTFDSKSQDFLARPVLREEVDQVLTKYPALRLPMVPSDAKSESHSTIPELMTSILARFKLR